MPVQRTSMADTHHGFHEDLRREDEARPGAERAFGLVFAAVCAAIALWPLTGGAAPRPWALAVAAGFAAVALIRPRWLAAPNRVWFRLGLVLHRVVSPLVLAFLFFVAVTPLGLLLRALGKTPLGLGFDRKAASYWIERRPPGPAPDTLRRQF
jgi:hypothetical protein